MCANEMLDCANEKLVWVVDKSRCGAYTRPLALSCEGGISMGKRIYIMRLHLWVEWERGLC